MLTSAGLAFWISRQVNANLSLGIWLVVAIAGVAGFFLARTSASTARSSAERIARHEPGTIASGDTLAPSAHPFRARLDRALSASVPTVSARSTALIVGLLLLASAILLPVSLKLPFWLELEFALALWWIVLFGVLAVLLYRGTRVREDHQFRVRWNLPDLGARQKRSDSTSRGSRWFDLDPGCTDIEGFAGLLVGVMLAALAFVATFILVELAFPALFFLLYWLVVKAIGRIANDRHGCERNLARSVGWGALWAILYTLPLAGVVYGAHFLAAKGH